MKYVDNAITFICTLAVLLLCVGTALGTDSVADLSKAALETLPFGTYLWDGYLTLIGAADKTDAMMLANGNVAENILYFVSQIMKLVITWFIYRFLVRNAVSILMTAFSDGSDNLFSLLKAEIIYNVGFLLSAMASEYIIIFLNMLFKKLGDSLTVIIVQIISYGIFTAGAIAIIIFVIMNTLFLKSLWGALGEGLARLLTAACFFAILHFFVVFQHVSVYLAIILIMGIGVSIMFSSLGASDKKK